MLLFQWLLLAASLSAIVNFSEGVDPVTMAGPVIGVVLQNQQARDLLKNAASEGVGMLIDWCTGAPSPQPAPQGKCDRPKSTTPPPKGNHMTTVIRLPKYVDSTTNMSR